MLSIPSQDVWSPIPGDKVIAVQPKEWTSQRKGNFMFTVDLGLGNEARYNGCDVEEVAGRNNLKTPGSEAGQIVGRNISAILSDVSPDERSEVTLTGPMAVWSYLVVFHAVVHAFSKVWYSDGRNEPVLIAAHG